MSVPLYDIKEQWIGTGDTVQYTFDYKIAKPNWLVAILQDPDGNIVQTVRGDDTTVLIESIEFDPINGGGTVTLLQDLPTSYVLTMLLAPDWPTQPSEFKDKFSFTLALFEQALDYITAPIQRLAYLAQRSMRLSDVDDATNLGFSAVLPPGANSNPGATICINPASNGFVFGPTLQAIDAAEGYAEAAAASAAAAAASAVEAATTSGNYVVSPAVPLPYASPLLITGSGITWGIQPTSGGRQMQFIKGSGGPVSISANPQISAGVNPGAELCLFGCDDIDTVSIADGNGVHLNGNCTLADSDVLCLTWDGTTWRELYRRIGAD